jgi:hypothetical protein
MLIPAHPFRNQYPMGLGVKDPAPPQRLVDVAAQAAAASDGRVHSDLSLLKNWKLFTNLSIGGGPTPLGIAPCFDPKSRRWLVFGMNIVGEAEVAYTVSGTQWLIITSIEASAPGPNLTPKCSYVNAAGHILVGGFGSGPAATINKLRDSVDGGATWNYRAIGASDTSTVVSLAYSETLRIWVASQTGAETGIWSSTDRITWTKRSSVIAANLIVRESPSPLFIAHGTTAPSNAHLTSTDGINWVVDTSTATHDVTGRRGTWNEHHGYFFIPTTATGIYRSATGLPGSWSQVSAFNATQLCSFGRALVRGDGSISLDAGVTWFLAVESAVPGMLPICGPGVGVMLCTDESAADIFISQIGGY